MTSINTNQSAMVALETLRGINSQLNTLNDQISTGKKVNNARDNAAVWAIATTMSSDVSSFNKVSESLSLASATVGVARSASESIVELLTEVKELTVQAQSKTSDDRAKIQTDIDNLSAQINDIVEAAQFNGTNLLNNTVTNSYLSSFNRSDSGVATDSIDVAGQNLLVGSAGTPVTGDLSGTGNEVTGVTFSGVDGSSSAVDDGVAMSIASSTTVNEGDNFSITIAGDTFTYEAAAGDTGAEVTAGLAALAAAALPTGVTDVQAGVNGGTGAFELTFDTSANIAVTGDSAVRTLDGVEAGGALGALASLSVLDDASATTALATIEALISTATDAAASFGSAQKRIDIQGEFVLQLMDSLELGVSALTDADLEKASSELTALQTQQQLGIQSLSIANQNPQTILSLFQ